MNSSLAHRVIVSSGLLALFCACGGGGTGGTGGGSATGGGSGGSGGAGGGMGSGTAVTVAPTTPTTTIPVGATSCSGTTYGDSGDLMAINVPVFQGSTNVSALTLRFDMGYYFGEPTRRAVISWDGTGSLSSVQWLAEVRDRQGRQFTNAAGARVYASYNVGSIKGPGQGFGVDSTGSPSWSQTFVTWDDATGTAFGVTTDEAKNIYRACFDLAAVRVTRLNGQPALTP